MTNIWAHKTLPKTLTGWKSHANTIPYTQRMESNVESIRVRRENPNTTG